MKTSSILPGALLFALCLACLGCTKNLTTVVEDKERRGLAIFSNTKNNLMTCYIGATPWRTSPRIVNFLIGGTRYELTVAKSATSSALDTLSFNWSGAFLGNINQNGNIGLVLPVPKTFDYTTFLSLQGQRLAINTTNGYFTLNLVNNNTVYGKGTGNIYFHKAQLDSIGPRIYGGTLSGIFDADFNTIKVENGRFDHSVGSDVNVFLR